MPDVTMQNPRIGKRFFHLSIRVSSNVSIELEREVKRQGTTVNALVNRVLERYLAFDRMADYDHSVTIERGFFEKIIEKASSEDLVEIARILGPKIVKRDFAFFNIAPTLDNLVAKYFEPVGAFSDRFDLNISGEAPDLKLVLTHEYGRKWSEFLGEYCDQVIESVLGVKPLIKVEDDLVTIEFRPGTLLGRVGNRSHSPSL
jgi:hypothetical protein